MERVNNSCPVGFSLGGDGITVAPSDFPLVDSWTVFLLGSVFFLVSTLIVRRKKTSSGAAVHLTVQDVAKVSRKQAFLSKYGDEYGYRRGSEKGYIDNWRHHEFPTLQPPLSSQESTHTCSNEEHEIYLDYAGSLLSYSVFENVGQSAFEWPSSVTDAVGNTTIEKQNIEAL